MANQKERMKAIIAKDVRDILQFELKGNFGFLTVSDVDVTDDFSYVRIYVSFFNNQEDNFKKLEKTKGYVRSSLCKKIDLRRAPDIAFILDRGFSNEKKIEDILNKEKEAIEALKKM